LAVELPLPGLQLVVRRALRPGQLLHLLGQRLHALLDLLPLPITVGLRAGHLPLVLLLLPLHPLGVLAGLPLLALLALPLFTNLALPLFTVSLFTALLLGTPLGAFTSRFGQAFTTVVGCLFTSLPAGFRPVAQDVLHQ